MGAGDVASNREGNRALLALKAAMRDMPRTVAAEVALRAAGEMTGLERGAHAAKRTVYGDPYPTGVDGNQLTVRATGKTLDNVRFETLGTIVRCKLPTDYAKYLIGKYRILPNGAIPQSWREALDKLVAPAAKRAMP